MKAESRWRAAQWSGLLVSLVIFALFALAAWKLGFFGRNAPEKVVAEAERIAGRRWLAPIFVLVYATLCAFALPVTVLAYGAGAIFGFLRGTLYIWTASMLGATGGYLLGRSVLSRAARSLLGAYQHKLGDLKKGSSALRVFRARLAPMAFGVTTYASAIAKVPLGAYLAGTAAGIIPGTLLSTFIGDRFVAGVSGRSHGALWLAIGMSVVLLGLSLIPNLVKTLRRT